MIHTKFSVSLKLLPIESELSEQLAEFRRLAVDSSSSHV